MSAPCSGGASAPGKLMIAGEYAVLEGATALVAAVDARARVRWSAPLRDGSPADRDGSPGSARLPPEALLARKRAEAVCGPVPCAMTLDVTALRKDGRKLGLGSSAAAAAAAAGAVFGRAGRDPAGPDRRAVLDAALEGHRTVAPEGSGADVAAAVLGGFVRVRRQADGHLDADPVAWPAGLRTRVVWTGLAARTSDLVRAVRALAEADRTRYRAAMDGVARAASELVDAVASGDVTGAVAAAEAHARALAELGEASGAPIVEERLSRIRGIARSLGGAAKPSGAGGGDVAVAFFADEPAASRFAQQCREAGWLPLDVKMGARGVVWEA